VASKGGSTAIFLLDKEIIFTARDRNETLHRAAAYIEFLRTPEQGPRSKKEGLWREDGLINQVATEGGGDSNEKKERRAGAHEPSKPIYGENRKALRKNK